MRNCVFMALVFVGLNACTTPAEHFEHVVDLNNKVSVYKFKALNAKNADEFKVAKDGVDEVLNSLNSFKGLNDDDSLYFYVKKNAEFTSQFLSASQDVLLKGLPENAAEKKKEFIESSGFLNDKVKRAAAAFMKEYELNVFSDLVD